MLLDDDIKIGHVYAWDKKNELSSIHSGTLTVRLLKLTPRKDGGPLATVESIQTGEIFSADTNWLSTIKEVRSMLAFYIGNPQPSPRIHDKDWWEERMNEKILRFRSIVSSIPLFDSAVYFKQLEDIHARIVAELEAI